MSWLFYAIVSTVLFAFIAYSMDIVNKTYIEVMAIKNLLMQDKK
jgi:hypothetical protein